MSAAEGRPSMSLRLSSRRGLLSWTFLLLGLSVAVFAWGLKYKLSLYDPPQSISHSIPAAKLLSKDERASGAADLGPATADRTSEVSHLGSLQSIYFLVILVMSWSFLLAETRLRWPDFSLTRFVPYVGLAIFSFRPPPTLL